MIKIFIPSLVVTIFLLGIVLVISKLPGPTWLFVTVAFIFGWFAKLIDREMTRYSEED